MKKECINWSDENSYERAIQTLKEGLVVLSDTDTVPGLLAPICAQGYESLNKIKNRKSKPYLVLVSDLARARELVRIVSPAAERIMSHCWPGPVTLIMPAKKTVPRFALGPGDTIAIRVPDYAHLRVVLQSFPGLFSTSANLTDEPVPCCLETVDSRVSDQVVLCVLDENNSSSKKKPSTIIDCTKNEIKIVREGEITASQINAIIAED